MKTITAKQYDTLVFMESFVSENGYSPSFEEIRKALNLKSREVVSERLKFLRLKGYIEYKPKTARSIRVIIKSNDNPNCVEPCGEYRSKNKKLEVDRLFANAKHFGKGYDK